MSGITKSYDVIVVGAGPSGLNTAFGLARNGHKVLIIEAKEEVGKDVVCAGVVGKELFEKFEISRNSIIRPVCYAQVCSPSGTIVSYEEQEPFAYVIDRKLFDKELLDRAITAGAEIALNTSARDIEIRTDGVSVTVEIEKRFSDILNSQVLVLATGIRTELSRKVGLGYPERFLKAVQEEVPVSRTLPLSVFVGNEISDSAFAWAIPTRDEFMRVGLMAEDDCIERFRKFSVKNFPHSKFDSPEVKPIAQGLVSRTFGDRVLVVGEAAGQVKTTTGGGIYWGMQCADIAVNVLVSAFKKGDFSAKTLSEYEKGWQKLIGDEIKSGLIVRKLCSYLNDSQIERIIQLARTDGLIDFIRQNALFDWHGKALINLLKMKSITEIIKS
jgi:geranylgeranyl reductase family protein